MNELEVEYILLNNFRENVVHFRGVLFTVDYTILEQIKNNSLILLHRGKLEPTTFQPEHKEKFQSALQISIISKLMMYEEDMIIFMESFRQKTNFYNFLNNKDIDVGKMISKFIDDFEKLDDSQLELILNYHNVDKLECDEKIKTILRKGFQGNYDEFRQVLKKLIDFGRANHPIYRRYKHAGFPIFPAIDISKTKEFLSNFERCSIISTGKDPLTNVDCIPFSEDILQGYTIIYRAYREILEDLIQNKLVCIERNLEGMIPMVWLKPDIFTKEEFDQLLEFVKKFYSNHPKQQIITEKINFDMSKDQNLEWYTNISDFLKEAKNKSEYEKTEVERLGAAYGGFGAENLCPMCNHDRRYHISKKLAKNPTDSACTYSSMDGQCKCTQFYDPEVL